MTVAVDRLWQHAQVASGPGGRIGLEFLPAACSRCEAGRGCGAGVFARLFTRRRVWLPAPRGLQARPGTRVRVGVPAASLARIAWCIYGLPLGAFLAAAVMAGGLVTAPGMADMLSLAAGLVAGCAVLVWQGVRLRRRTPDILVRLPEASGGS